MTRAPAKGYRGRFAPSPTGDLHPGSLLAALGSWLMARWNGGTWDVRIEDLDPPREVPGMGDRHLAWLAAFGMHPDGPVIRQSDRALAYQAALDRLLADGLAFQCLCSRADLASSGGIHRRCVTNPSGRQPAVRLRLPDQEVVFVDALRGRCAQNLASEVGDMVLRRADGPWAYQLAVVVDDACQDITDVVRGADLLDSTPRQIYLQSVLGLPTPRYAHLPLLRTKSSEKLGKSLGSLAVDPADPLPMLARAYAWLGQDPAQLNGARSADEAMQRALDGFDPVRLPTCDQVLSAI